MVKCRYDNDIDGSNIYKHQHLNAEDSNMIEPVFYGKGICSVFTQRISLPFLLQIKKT